MRFKIHKRGGYEINKIGIAGGEVNGAVYLSRDPVGELEAATKNYVDNKMNNLDASAFIEGKLGVNVLPEFRGDITKEAKKNHITVTPTGVVAGTYTKVSVNAKGQVVSGGSLVESDLPSIPFAKVASGRPTTLAGYGIVDALSVEGGTMTGKLTATALGNDPFSVVNKDYVDSQLSGGGQAVVTGGIVYKALRDNHEGFLECNGGIVDRAMYAGLFDVIGERFGAFLHPGNGKPWVSQNLFNTLGGDAGFGEWQLNSQLPIALDDAKAFVTKNRIHVVGGRTTSTHRNTVYSAPINEDGSLGAWVSGTTLPAVRRGGEVVVTKNRVYYIGGWSSNTALTNTIYSAVINEDGTLGTWAAQQSMSLSNVDGMAVITRGKLHYLGGANTSSSVSIVLTGAIGTEDGILTETLSSRSTLPVPIKGAGSVVIGKYCYVIGGANGSYNVLGSVSNAIYRSEIINSDGELGNFVYVGALPAAVAYVEIVTTEDKIFVLGMHNTAGNVNKIMVANINPDDSLGAWTFSDVSVPSTFNRSSLVIIRNKAYILGGLTTGGASTRDIYVANFSGGKSDYSLEYGSMFMSSLVDRTKFQLPNITPEVAGATAYIKY